MATSSYCHEVDITGPLEGRITQDEVKEMAEELANDELISMRLVDVNKILLAFLTEKYEKMLPCDLQKVYSRRFFDQYEDFI